jgi:hypothetical protein
MSKRKIAAAEETFPDTPLPSTTEATIDQSKPLLEGNVVRVYGHKFDRRKFNNMFAIELWCFLHEVSPEIGGLGKFGHFRNAVDLWFNSPESKKRFDWHPWAIEMGEAACANKYLAIAGCASSGKTDFAAIWAIINWLASPLNTMVLVTSTSLKDSRKRIWGSIREYFTARPGLPGKLVDSYGLIRLEDPTGEYKGSDRCGIALIAAAEKMEKDAVGKLIGFKNARVLLIADELPELSEAILEAAYGNLSKNPFFQLIGLGNPNSHYDAFGTFARPREGWSSISAESHVWETDRGICLRFDGKYSPNIVAGETLYPYLLTQERYDNDARLFGENSATFWRMVRGFWSPTGISEGVYTESEIIQYHAEPPAIWYGEPIRVAALDPSFTNGGDRTAAMFGQYGKNKDGLFTLSFDEVCLIKEDVTDKNTPRSFQICKQFIDLCESRGIDPKNVALDVSGGGAPFADVLTSLWSNQFYRVNFAGRASDGPISVFDQTKSCDRYANRVTEIWFSGKELIRTGQLKGIFPALAKEMCARLYTSEKSATSKVRVEPKPLMKARTGESPDIADAAFILLDLCRARLRMASADTAGNAPPRSTRGWSHFARKFDVAGRAGRFIRR